VKIGPVSLSSLQSAEPGRHTVGCGAVRLRRTPVTSYHQRQNNAAAAAFAAAAPASPP